MEEYDRQVLNQKLPYLVEHIIPCATFMANLHKQRIFNNTMMERISAITNRADKVSMMITLLQRRGDNAFDRFLVVLRDSEHQFVADELLKERERTKPPPHRETTTAKLPQLTTTPSAAPVFPRANTQPGTLNVQIELSPGLHPSCHSHHSSAYSLDRSSYLCSPHLPDIPRSSTRIEPPSGLSPRPVSAFSSGLGDSVFSFNASDPANMSFLQNMIDARMDERLRVHHVERGRLEDIVRQNADQIRVVTSKLTEYETQVSNLQVQVSGYREEVANLTRTKQELEKENTELKQKLDEMKQEGRNSSPIEDLVGMKQLRRSYKEVAVERDKSEVQCEKLSEENQQLKKDKAFLSRRVTALQGSRAAQSHISRMRAVNKKK